MPNEAVVVSSLLPRTDHHALFPPHLAIYSRFGQAMMNNESFGQLGFRRGRRHPIGRGNSNRGVTPSPTPTNPPTATQDVTSTPTQRATNTPTVTPNICRVLFDSPPIADFNYVLISGELGP
ncbi:MAG: hypothetical protein IPG51_17550 [Chloroflexi bacterium]|nr:hypothetical protein [Chloroflexota bacterium]